MTDDRKRRKNEQSKAAYAAAKAGIEATLLRLDRGSLARLDAARLPAGLSRSAFVEIYLLPIADALSPMLQRIDEARRSTGASLATFVARAIVRSLDGGEAAATTAGDEFDSLFGEGAHVDDL